MTGAHAREHDVECRGDVLRTTLREQFAVAAPGEPWTLAALAAQAGVSRTTLAKRFAELVGEPPLTYLTRWRMTLAADMLAESTATVAAVARRLGYADPFGFSTAFKRIYGMSPSEHRQVGTMSRGSGANADGRGTMVGCIGS